MHILMNLNINLYCVKKKGRLIIYDMLPLNDSPYRVFMKVIICTYIHTYIHTYLHTYIRSKGLVTVTLSPVELVDSLDGIRRKAPPPTEHLLPVG